MKFFDKIKQGINPGEDQDYDDTYTDQIQNDFSDANYQGGASYAPQNEAYAPEGGMAMSSSSLELKVVKPKHYDDGPQIANHLLNNRTVVLNLELTNKETARRLIDFLCGVVYSIKGSIKKVAENTYVLTPCNVDVSGDQFRDRSPKKSEDDSDSYSNDI